MRFSTVFATCALFSAAAASALTARQDALPTCAVPCVTGAPTGDCGSNVACLCKDQNFVSSTTICIQKACTGSDLETAERLSRENCEAVGVTLTQTSFSQTETNSAASSSSASESASSQANSSGTPAGTTTGTGTSSTGAAGTGSNTAAQSSQTSPTSTGTAPATTSTGAASSSRTISTFALVGAVALGALAL